jgi:hypothetical protein
MAAEHWLRWHHGTTTDPKWRVVAARASATLSRPVTAGHALSVWAVMLECASQANPRGELVGWVDEDVAAALGYLEEEVAAIRNAMQGKTLDGWELTAWKRRQPKAEDATAGSRKARQRERERALQTPGTDRDNDKGHAASRPVTTETETETDKNSSLRSSSSAHERGDEDGLSPAAICAELVGFARIPESLDRELLARFVRHRRVSRRPISVSAWLQLLPRFAELKAQGHDLNESLRQTMAAGLSIPVTPSLSGTASTGTQHDRRSHPESLADRAAREHAEQRRQPVDGRSPAGCPVGEQPAGGDVIDVEFRSVASSV